MEFTNREKDIAYLLIEGIVKGKNIAKRLNLKQDTIRKHLSKMYSITGVSSKSELLFYLISNQEIWDR